MGSMELWRLMDPLVDISMCSGSASLIDGE